MVISRLNLVIWLSAYLAISPSIAPPLPEISGVVRDVLGRGIDGVIVSLQRVRPGAVTRTGRPGAKDLTIVETMRTPVTGAFRFANVPPGRYQLTVARANTWMIAENLVIDEKPRGPIMLTLDGKTRVVSLLPTPR
jgi:hypothetical protein